MTNVNGDSSAVDTGLLSGITDGNRVVYFHKVTNKDKVFDPKDDLHEDLEYITINGVTIRVGDYISYKFNISRYVSQVKAIEHAVTSCGTNGREFFGYNEYVQFIFEENVSRVYRDLDISSLPASHMADIKVVDANAYKEFRYSESRLLNDDTVPEKPAVNKSIGQLFGTASGDSDASLKKLIISSNVASSINLTDDDIRVVSNRFISDGKPHPTTEEVDKAVRNRLLSYFQRNDTSEIGKRIWREKCLGPMKEVAEAIGVSQNEVIDAVRDFLRTID